MSSNSVLSCHVHSNNKKMKHNIMNGFKLINAASVIMIQRLFTWLLSSFGNLTLFLSLMLVIYRFTMFSWYVINYWLLTHAALTVHWNKVIDIIGEDNYTLWVVYSTILNMLVYWTIGGIYTFFDVTKKPAFIQKYKVQQENVTPFDKTKLAWVIFVVLFNQTVVSLIALWPLEYLMRLRGPMDPRKLPSLIWVISEFPILIFFEDFGYYYAHRFIHAKFLYKHIHKMHHEWNAPIAISALYSHPLEHIASNILPVYLGIIGNRCHILTAFVWHAVSTFYKLNRHSGYHLPFLPSPEAHDYHHKTFTECFGIVGIFDRLHGTDLLFRLTEAFPRDVTLTGLSTAREIYPDEENITKKKTYLKTIERWE